MKQNVFKGLLLLTLAACGNKNNSPAKNNTISNASAPTDSVIIEKDAAQLPEAVNTFVLPNYAVLKFKKGDINNDNREDVVVILAQKNEQENGDALRPLLLIVQNESGKYTLAARNDHVVACLSCGGKLDPLADIAVKNGFFTIEHEGGSREMWTKNITFRFDSQQKTWFLHRIDDTSVDTFASKNKNSKTRTAKEFGKIPFVDYDSEKMDN